MGLTMFFFAPVAGAALSRFDPRKVIFIGLSIAATGVWLNAQLTTQSDYWEFFWPQILRGIGMMMGLITMSQLALSTLPLQKIKFASGLYNLTRNIGGAIGLAVINTLLERQTALHVTALDSHLTPSNPQVMDYLNSLTAKYQNLGDQAYAMAVTVLNRQVHLQALTLAFNDVLKILAFIMLFAATLVVFVKRSSNKQAGPTVAH
jgi:DHA2 family multidrug resistance protein